MRVLIAAHLLQRRAARQGSAGAPAPATRDGRRRALMPIGFDPAIAAGARPARPIAGEARRRPAPRGGYGERAYIGAAAEAVPEGEKLPQRARWSR
jgi:hypothetical protein